MEWVEGKLESGRVFSDDCSDIPTISHDLFSAVFFSTIENCSRELFLTSVAFCSYF